MIAKALVLVCAAFGLVAGSCFDVCAPRQSAQVIAVQAPAQSTYATEVVSSGCSSGNTFEVVAAAPATYAVQPTDGPDATPLSVIQSPAVTLPAVEGPVITLSSQPIPATRVLSQRCICTKTILKPQVYQRHVTAPRLQRYLKRTVTPVVENVSYKSTPITQNTSSGSAIVIPGSAPAQASAPVCVSAPAPAPVVYASAPAPAQTSSVVYSSEPSYQRVC